MNNPLATQLRTILTELEANRPGRAAGHVAELLGEVERLAGQPAETGGGLEPEQEIRADALVGAARLLAPALAGMSWIAVEMNLPAISDVWLTLAGRAAGFVADGSRPA